MAPSSNEVDQKLSRSALVALVVGSMVGSGIFALPASFGRVTGVLGTMIAWVIAGTGMLMLAFVFQTLSRRRPDLDAGIYAYAKAGFGDYIGFASAAGYWTGCCLADVACLILIKATIGQFLPVFGDGTTAAAIASASLLVWCIHFLVLRGIKGAAALNTVATYAKIIPILLFIGVAFVVLDPGLISQNFWGTEQPSVAAVSEQVRNTMLLTVFVFVGVEGASVYSRYARDRSDIGFATIAGFLSVLCLLVLVTLLSYGVMTRQELTGLPTPSMAGVMEAMVGRWGAVFVSVALLISILGNYLSWSLLAAEVLHSAAVNRTMPSFLARVNAHQVPSRRALADELRHPGISSGHLVCRVCVYARLEDDERNDADPLFSGRGLRGQAGLARQLLPCRRTGPHGRRSTRGCRNAVRDRHDLRRRPEIPAAVVDTLRAGNVAVLSRQAREQGSNFQAVRGHHLCRGRACRLCRHLRADDRRDLDLKSCWSNGGGHDCPNRLRRADAGRMDCDPGGAAVACAIGRTGRIRPNVCRNHARCREYQMASNTKTKPTKHRYWRHRGGSHPHYGSRRIRT